MAARSAASPPPADDNSPPPPILSWLGVVGSEVSPASPLSRETSRRAARRAARRQRRRVLLATSRSHSSDAVDSDQEGEGDHARSPTPRLCLHSAPDDMAAVVDDALANGPLSLNALKTHLESHFSTDSLTCGDSNCPSFVAFLSSHSPPRWIKDISPHGGLTLRLPSTLKPKSQRAHKRRRGRGSGANPASLSTGAAAIEGLKVSLGRILAAQGGPVEVTTVADHFLRQFGVPLMACHTLADDTTLLEAMPDVVKFIGCFSSSSIPMVTLATDASP